MFSDLYGIHREDEYAKRLLFLRPLEMLIT